MADVVEGVGWGVVEDRRGGEVWSQPPYTLTTSTPQSDPPSVACTTLRREPSTPPPSCGKASYLSLLSIRALSLQANHSVFACHQ